MIQQNVTHDHEFKGEGDGVGRLKAWVRASSGRHNDVTGPAQCPLTPERVGKGLAALAPDRSASYGHSISRKPG